MCYDLNKNLVIKEFIEPKYKKFKSSALLSPTVKSDDVFEGIVRGIFLHVIDLAHKDKGDGSFGFGIGVDVDVNLSVFCGNCLNMMSQNERSSHTIFFIENLFDSKTFERSKRWLSKIKPPRNPHVVRIVPNIKQSTVSVYVAESIENFSDELASVKDLKMTADDIRFFNSAAKRIAPKLSGIAAWCESQIEALEKSDTIVDECFFDQCF